MRCTTKQHVQKPAACLS